MRTRASSAPPASRSSTRRTATRRTGRGRSATRGPRPGSTEHEGRITGTTTVGPSREEGAATGLGELWSIAVEPGAQGAGLGSALHAHACVRLGALGFTAAMLWVFEENGLARAFYEARGWTLDLPGAGTAPEEWYLAPCVRYRRVVG